MSNHIKAILITCVFITGLSFTFATSDPWWGKIFFFAVMATISIEIFTFVKDQLDKRHG